MYDYTIWLFPVHVNPCAANMTKYVEKTPKPPKQFIKTHNQSQFGALTLAQLEPKPKTERNKNWNEGNVNSEHENQ